MTRLFFLLFASLLAVDNIFGQVPPPDSIYNGWLANRARSIFQQVDHGQFFGTTTGYLQVANGKDTLLLDFQESKTTLSLIKDKGAAYDNSTKKYSTQTTSGKTALAYEAYSLANSILIVLNGKHYLISTIDGACDMPINGLKFNYCHEGNTEYLTLFVEKPLQLTSVDYLLNSGKIDYQDAKKIAKKITILAGSTLILTMKK